MNIQGKSLKLNKFLESEYIKEAIEAKHLTKQTLDMLVDVVVGSGAIGGKGKSKTAAAAAEAELLLEKPISFEQFSQIIQLIERAKSTGGEDEEGDDDDEDDFDALSDEEIEEMRKEVFEELKSKKTDRVSIDKFMKWESIQDAISSSDLTEDDVMNAIREGYLPII